MEIKRVIAGGLATLAAGATLALGAGATLGDFVTTSGNTMTSPYIVIGGNAKAEDTLAAADIGVALAGQATENVAVSGSQATMSVTNGAMLEVPSARLYKDDRLDSSDIKPTFLESDLSTLLASGKVKQDDNKEIDYSQYLKLGVGSAGMKVVFDRQSSWDDPALYLNLVDGENLYTYELIFSQGLDVDEIGDKGVTFLGVPYVFSDVSGELGGTTMKVTLFGAGQTETVQAGSSTTVTVAGDDYVITVVGVGENNDAVIDVNGEQFDVDASGDDPTSLDITKDDLSIHVKSVRALKYPAESGAVQMFIGSEKTVLQTGQKVEVGEDDVDGSLVTITNTTTLINKIKVEYTIQDDDEILAGDSITDPVFDAFKIAFGGIYPALDDATKDVVKVEKNSDKVELTFTNKDGDEYSMPILYLNDSFASVAVAGVSLDLSDGSDPIYLNNNQTISDGDYVVVTTGEYTYILQFTDYTSDDEVILTDVSTDAEYTITANTQEIYPGKSGRAVKVTAFAPGGGESVALNNTGAGVNTIPVIYTEHGANITIAMTDETFGVSNDTYPLTNYAGYIYVQEHDFKTTDDVTEAAIKIQTTNDTEVDQVAISSPTPKTDDQGDYKYTVTKGGTYVVENVDDEVVTVYTPEEPNAVYVAVGSDPEFAGGGTAGGTVKQAVQIKNSISKLESEINTATLTRDLVLIGGPCANGLVAEVLGMSAASGTCAAEFTAEYPTEGVIKVVNDAFDSGQKVLVVAGVNRQKTRDLAVKVMQGTVDYAA